MCGRSESNFHVGSCPGYTTILTVNQTILHHRHGNTVLFLVALYINSSLKSKLPTVGCGPSEKWITIAEDRGSGGDGCHPQLLKSTIASHMWLSWSTAETSPHSLPPSWTHPPSVAPPQTLLMEACAKYDTNDIFVSKWRLQRHF